MKAKREEIERKKKEDAEKKRQIDDEKRKRLQEEKKVGGSKVGKGKAGDDDDDPIAKSLGERIAAGGVT